MIRRYRKLPADFGMVARSLLPTQIRNHYQTCRHTVARWLSEMADDWQADRLVCLIRVPARQPKHAGRPHKIWTADEDAMIRKGWSFWLVTTLAKKLDRSVHAVLQRGYHLGMPRSARHKPVGFRKHRARRSVKSAPVVAVKATPEQRSNDQFVAALRRTLRPSAPAPAPYLTRWERTLAAIEAGTLGPVYDPGTRAPSLDAR